MNRRTPTRDKRDITELTHAPDGAAKRPRPQSRVRAYFANHLWVLVSSLGQLWRTPLSTVMTSAVIGIAMALPGGLHVVLENVQSLAGGWQGAAQISVFLKKGVPDSQARALADRVRSFEEVGDVVYISPAQALEEFRRQSGFGEALDALDDNPLPAVLVVHPAANTLEPFQLERLTGRLRAQDGVELAQLDMEWVQRLNAMIEVGQRGVLLLGALLGVAVLLVVGNTIRLTIHNRRDEIVISKLIGATNGFIRRPFLYTGLWYGLFGAVIAWLLVALFLSLLAEPVSHLSLLYHSSFTLSGMDLATTALLGLASITLGYLGSWLAVGRHLQAIEPT